MSVLFASVSVSLPSYLLRFSFISCISSALIKYQLYLLTLGCLSWLISDPFGQKEL